MSPDNVLLPEAPSAQTPRRASFLCRQLDPDVHHEYEFGGPVGTAAMMVGFPALMYYLYICLVVFDGWPQYPLALGDVVPFLSRFYQLAKKVCISRNRPVLSVQCP